MAVSSKNKQLQKVEIAISIEKQQYLLDYIPCLCQIHENEKFSYCGIGISKQEILLYSDMEPNRIVDNVYFYNAFATLLVKEIVTLVKSEITRNEELRNYIRLDIFMKNAEDSKIIYFPKSDKSKVARFLRACKSVKLKVINNVINYSLGTY